MASKAKSGMSAVRQFWENILSPPNKFTAGAASFTTAVRDGKGHSAIHASVTNDTAGTLQILQAWRSSGPFVLVKSLPTALDPVSGKHTADIVFPIVRRFVKVVFNAPPPGLGAAFELGAYFEPRADSDELQIAGGVIVTPGGGGGGGAVTITGVVQVPITVTSAALAAGASAASANQDVTNYEGFGVSVYVKSGPALPLTAHLLVENSLDGVTFDPVDNVPLNNPANNSSKDFERVYDTTRKFYRATVVNDDGANALAETRFGIILKPI